MTATTDERPELILAAEECEPAEFQKLHRFSRADEGIISKLVAHGPVLLRGGRGCGKSALMLEAKRRMAPVVTDSPALGIYVSLRRLELLRSREAAYERFLCHLVAEETRKTLDGVANVAFDPEPTVTSLQGELSRLSSALGKRVVLFFDDAAHIGREASLAEFFDIFRTVSSGSVSCKASIYPGVTRFGTRFDVLNDATVLDVSRNQELPGFSELFNEVMRARYPGRDYVYSERVASLSVAAFLGQAVLGNMRAFVFACNALVERVDGGKITFNTLTDVLLNLSSNYYWPLLDELKPKLGIYEPMVQPAKEVAEVLFQHAGKQDGSTSVLVHRDLTERLAKPFEMLEYAGFISRREASRAMKSRGRGSRYALNLCGLLEGTPGSRLTGELHARWTGERLEPTELHRGSDLTKIDVPKLQEAADLEILKRPIECLRKSNAYPYGLTEAKIAVLRDAGLDTVGALADATDESLKLPTIGDVTRDRIRNVVAQAIWM